jgi:hypothetical protein
LRTATYDAAHRHHDGDRSGHDPLPVERIALSGITTGGALLPPDVRADMEARLGGDFSAVRVHTGDAAARSADALAAEAYTVGDDIVFARGVYAPHDPLGRLRLAHELAHVLQQRSGAPRGGLSDPADSLELAAESTARAALAGPRPAGVPRRPAAARTAPDRTVVQRRAVLDLPPARERASEVAADSPWLGMTAPGMIDFRTSTPTVTPTPSADGPTRGAAPTGSDERASAPELDPLARPQPEPPEPARTAPPPPEPGNEAARTAELTAARAVAATDEAFRGQPTEDAPAATAPAEADEHDPRMTGTEAGPETARPRPAPPGAAAAPETAQQDQGKRDGTLELQLPKFPDETAEEFFGLVAADRQGQRALQAAVTRALADVATMMDRESARVDADLATAQNAITAAVRTARGRVQGAAATARARVDRARTEQGTRVTTQVDRKKSTARTDVEQVAHDIEDVGSHRADEAQRAGTDAADELERTRDQRMRDARRTGEDRAARAASYVEEPEIRSASVSAQRQAAHEVAEQTAHAIDDAITGSVRDLRGGGPELNRAVAEQLRPVASDVRNQIDPIERSLTATGTQLATTLDGAVTNARQTIEATTRGLMDALTRIDRQTKQQLRTAADTTKTGLRQAQSDGERQLHDKASEFVQTAHNELQQQLQLVSSRPVRRMLARRLANELRSVLRSGYGMGAQQANQIAGRIASQLSGTLAQFHQEITAATEPAVSGAESTAHSAGTQFSQLERHSVDFLSRTVTDSLARVDTSQTERMTHLGQTVDVVNQRLQPFVDQTRTRVNDDKGRLNREATDKLADLDSRVEQAMTKARDKAELGAFGAWLLDQLRSLGRALITPSFWVGLLVGLLITIFIVATFGSGAVVLIVAGVVAGAISAAAAYTAQVYLDPLVDPHAPHKEFSAREMGYQMLIGGIAGGVGAAAGGLATAGVNAIVTNVASRVVVNRVAQTVVGAALGVVQNCMTGSDGGVHWQWHGEHWDEGLLTNVAVSVAMSSRHVEERIQGIQERARAGMVDRGLARNVTPGEMEHAQARMFERAGVTDPTAPRPAAAAVPDLGGVHVDAGPATPVAPAAGEPHLPVPAEPHVPPPAVPAEPHVPPAAPSERRVPPAVPAEPRAPSPAEPHAPPPAEARLATPTPESRPATPAPEVRPATPAEAGRPVPGEPRPAAPAEARPRPAAEAGPHAEPVAGTPQREGVPRPAAPSGEHAPGTAPHEPQLIDLPEHSVMSSDTPMTESDARVMYENARRDAPHNEVGIFRNSETGEHIVIQGSNEYVDSRTSRNAALREFLESRPGQAGRWDLVEHSHPVDPTRGVTHEAQRLPSGRNGDFDVARAESVARGGQPVEQRIGIVTERGNETVTYGYDPNHERPYSVTFPGPDGQPQSQRFRSMEAYGEWYESHPGTGGGSPHIEGESGVAAAPPRGRRAGDGTGPHGGAGTAPPAPAPATPPPPAKRSRAGARTRAGEVATGPGAHATPLPVPEETHPSGRQVREGPRPTPEPARPTGPPAPAAAPPIEHQPPPAPTARPEEHAPATSSAPRPEEHAPATASAPRPEEHAAATAPQPTPDAAATAEAAKTGREMPADPPGTRRDRRGRLRGPRGQFVDDPRTVLRQEITFPAERGESAPHTISAVGAEDFHAAQQSRQEAQDRFTTTRERVRDLAREHEIKPESLVRSEERQEVLQRLRMQGVSAQERGALLHAEQARARAQNRLRQQSERLGMRAGADVLRSEGHTTLLGDTEARGRPGEADLVGITPNGDSMRVVEAKGGTADLGRGRLLEGTELRAQQGSPEYLNEVLRLDPRFQQHLRDNPAFARRLANGEVKIEYHMVSAEADGTVTVTRLRLDIRGNAVRPSEIVPRELH